ncbi:MAG: hypothetical protein IKB16_12925 [Lentisphaeria bacterium]|nr:hypothetical protein [Lentisphaeria bacterium]
MPIKPESCIFRGGGLTGQRNPGAYRQTLIGECKSANQPFVKKMRVGIRFETCSDP